MSFSSSRMTGLVLCSKGRRIATPKLAARPGPTCPACMMPPPAPVMAIHPAWAIRRLNSTHAV